MDKKIAGLMGAVGALAAAAPLQGAAASPLSAATSLQVASYADLLKPIPNAEALLRASDAETLAQAVPLDTSVDGDAMLQRVQFHHHHHHHHGFGPRFVRPFLPPRYRRHHHHHHHHHFRGDGY